MPAFLSKTIAALCYEIAAVHESRDATGPNISYDDITGFVLEQLRKMPVFLSLPILLATAVFGMSRLLLDGSMFYKGPEEQRRLQVESWRRSKFGPSRDLMKFYTSLIVLALYSRPETSGKIKAGDG